MMPTKLAPPLLLVAPLLGALTVLLTLPPLNLPTWAAFITWGGAFLMEGKVGAGQVKRLVPALVLGTSTGAAATTLFQWNERTHGTSLLATLISMGIVFLAAWLLIALARFSLVALTPGTFLGFAALCATVAGNFGPSPHSLLMFWISATLMVCLGPLLAWATIALSSPQGTPSASHPVANVLKRELLLLLVAIGLLLFLVVVGAAFFSPTSQRQPMEPGRVPCSPAGSFSEHDLCRGYPTLRLLHLDLSKPERLVKKHQTNAKNTEVKERGEHLC